MKEKISAINWLKESGINATETPKRVFAVCLYPSPASPGSYLRPSISFDPSDPKSIERAKKAAFEQHVPPRMCGDYCPLPCTLRRLEDPNIDYIMSVFGINNTGEGLQDKSED